MTWMGAKADIATITALDTTGIEDGIAYRTISEKVWLGLDKTSTATVDGVTVWAATPAGRWHLIGGSGIATSSVEVVADLAALQALPSASQDKLYALDTTPPQAFIWDAESTAAVTDDIIKLTALTNGRMYRFYPVASGGGSSNLMIAPDIATILAISTAPLPNAIHYYAIAEKITLVLDKNNSASANDITTWASTDNIACWFAHPNSVIVGENPPPTTGKALPGTTYIHQPVGYDGIDASVALTIYVWPQGNTGGETWSEIYVSPRAGTGNPTTTGVPIPVWGRAFYLDTATNYLYYGFQDEYEGSWRKVVM